MAIHRVQREIDRIAKELFAPLFHLDKGTTGWRVISLDCEQGFCLTLEKNNNVLLVELEEQNSNRDCYKRTKWFNIHARDPMHYSRPLSSDERFIVDLLVKTVEKRELNIPNVERFTTSKQYEIREVEVEHLLMSESHTQYYINPYVGCMIGCEFCYVDQRADFSRKLEGLPKIPWGQYVDVKINAPEILEKEVKLYPPGIVRMAPIVTDPYQPIERKYQITRKCLKILLDAGFLTGFLTRSSLVLRDLDLLQQFPKTAICFSIPTDIDQYRFIFEPGSEPIEERFHAIREIHKQGIPTLAVIQPLLPLNVDNLVEQLAPYIQFVRIDRMYNLDKVMHLYQEHDIEFATTDEWFHQTSEALKKRFSDRGVIIHNMDMINLY